MSADHSGDMRLTLHVWRQDCPATAGHFETYPGAPEGDRKGLGTELRVARGNSWGNRDYSSPAAIRYPYPEDRIDSVIGFRCARDGG